MRKTEQEQLLCYLLYFSVNVTERLNASIIFLKSIVIYRGVLEFVKTA